MGIRWFLVVIIIIIIISIVLSHAISTRLLHSAFPFTAEVWAIIKALKHIKRLHSIQIHYLYWLAFMSARFPIWTGISLECDGDTEMSFYHLPIKTLFLVGYPATLASGVIKRQILLPSLLCQGWCTIHWFLASILFPSSICEVSLGILDFLLHGSVVKMKLFCVVLASVTLIWLVYLEEVWAPSMYCQFATF